MKGFAGLLHRRLVMAPGYSLQGLSAGIRHEEALRVELVLSTILVPLGLWLGNTGTEKALLVLVVFLVVIVELLNTGIEAVTDRVGQEHNELAGRAKDMGSAAVFISMLLVLLTWTLVLAPI